MRIKIGNELIPLNLLTWGLIIIVFFTHENILRIVLGIPLIIFFPGYSFMAMLFTKKWDISGTERIIFSFILSITIVSLL